MNTILNTKIENLNFSTRTYLCLKKAYSFNYVATEIKTVKDLVSLAPEQLLQIRNFGSKSLTEVENVLAAYNLHLGMTEEINNETLSNDEIICFLRGIDDEKIIILTNALEKLFVKQNELNEQIKEIKFTLSQLINEGSTGVMLLENNQEEKNIDKHL